MAQVPASDYPIPNSTGSDVRADLNRNLDDLHSTASGTTPPPAAGSAIGKLWVNTSTTPDTLCIKTGTGTTAGNYTTLGNIAANFGHATAASPTFTGNIGFPAGSSTSLPIRNSADTDTGIYFGATNELDIRAGNTDAHTFTSTASEPKLPLRGTNGSASAPSISFASDTNLGLYRSNTDHLSIATSGAERAYFNDNGLNIRTGLSLRLFDSDHSHYVGIKANSNTAANYDLILPNNSGSSNQILKSDGSGNLVWTTVASLQDSGKVKGVIAFNGADASPHHQSNLTVSRTGTGTYRVTINSSVRNGTNYGVVIGNIDESHAHGVGDLTTNSSNSGNADHFRVAFVSGRTGSYFDIRAYKFDSEVFTVSTDDNDRAITYRRVAADPSYVCLTFFS
tara:strand:+ start:21426 stop:22610 length:1185 start_codon:yes stop_codon:yes gene_type:complete